ncbi:hypothetical protein Q4555_09990 [Octadecabacter sp. 1_MG-2023]|uniref:hypothetical protein n=1 Tax=unclassified Octadecabacter TaxID=196158 RepID=UPI001C08F912|nr:MULTISPECIES: hypothetical protein [unclassified Octadecabacter]MBU2992240.1 hypothetical protein [Octadecabacter sp. B2R22]MDO6735004.1 hypothetical protein [Octadecabacter sp. 1_MG-2023]
MMKTATTIAVLAASPLAAQQFSMPAGCEAYLTIQSQSCSVSHYFRCGEDTNGEQRRATLDEEGMSYIGRINAQAEWLESFHLRSGHTERLSEASDQMNINELIANGVDTWDFVTESAEIGDSRYEGMDRLTGETIVIDGVTLLGTEYALTSYDSAGDVAWRSEGREYVSDEWNMFIGGESSYITSDDRFDSDDTPVEFIFPDEPGFLSTNPKFGCGVEMSFFDASNLPTRPIQN